MASFWEGILAGYGIAIPVGAIAVLIVDTSLRRGFAAGFAAGAGAATVDLLYATIAMLAGAAVALTLAPLATPLAIASGLVLMSLGAYGLWRAYRSNENPAAEIPRGEYSGVGRTYLQFLALTMLNPLTIVYFVALILGREAGLRLTLGDQILFVLGAGLASFSWQTLLAGSGALAKQYLSPRFRLYATIFGNLVVLGLGVRILVRLVS